MQDLSKFHKSISMTYQTNKINSGYVKNMALEKIKYALAKNLVDEHSESKESFGMLKVSISGFFFTESEMREFISNMEVDKNV